MSSMTPALAIVCKNKLMLQTGLRRIAAEWLHTANQTTTDGFEIHTRAEDSQHYGAPCVPRAEYVLCIRNQGCGLSTCRSLDDLLQRVRVRHSARALDDSDGSPAVFRESIVDPR